MEPSSAATLQNPSMEPSSAGMLQNPVMKPCPTEPGDGANFCWDSINKTDPTHLIEGNTGLGKVWAVVSIVTQVNFHQLQ